MKNNILILSSTSYKLLYKHNKNSICYRINSLKFFDSFSEYLFNLVLKDYNLDKAHILTWFKNTLDISLMNTIVNKCAPTRTIIYPSLAYKTRWASKSMYDNHVDNIKRSCKETVYIQDKIESSMILKLALDKMIKKSDYILTVVSPIDTPRKNTEVSKAIDHAKKIDIPVLDLYPYWVEYYEENSLNLYNSKISIREKIFLNEQQRSD